MNKKRLLAAGVASMMAVTILAAGCGGDKHLVKLSENAYDDGLTYEEGAEYSTINESLFYRNTRTVDVADPCVVYISDKDDPDYGSYFLYGTSSSTGFFCWKSTDLIHWDAVGYALMYNDQESLQGKALWQDTWASEVVFDSEAGKWYMYFSATPRDLSVTDGYAASKEYVCIPYIAESDSPRGPFELIDHVETYRTLDGTPLKDVAGRDESAEYFFQRYMTFDPYEMEQALQKLGLSENGKAEEEGEDAEAETDAVIRAIDYHPYVDPATQQKYLYFTLSHNSYIMGMKMTDWTTPDYSSLTVLTRPGYATVDAAEKNVSYESAANRVNEGSWITEHGGKYYLSFSINSSTNKTYSVCQAVGSSPLGPFRKLEESEGGILLSADASMRDDASGTGHHSIITIEGKDYIIYHSHNSVEEGGHARHVAVDEIKWITVKDVSGNDLPVMYANGPTTSVQPLPEFVSDYKNIAADAAVEATSVAEGSGVSWLTDGLLSINRYANADMVNTYVQETRFDGKTTITFTFEDYRTICALMIYNSKYKGSAFYEIERIEMDCKEADGSLVTRYIEKLQFDWNAYTSVDDEDVVRPASSAYAEFAEISCNEIRITIAPASVEQIPVHGMEGYTASGAEIAVSEIKVLGK